MDAPEQSQPSPPAESARERRVANIILLVVLAALVGGGVWLVNAMIEQRRIDDCAAQGRRNCIPLDLR